MRSDDTAVTTVRRDWAGHEAAMPGAWAELTRLIGRARRRWLRTLVWSLALASLATAAAAGRPRVYGSRALVRVEEGAVVPGDVGRAVLSDRQLGAVVVAHDLYGQARDRRAAIATMRAALDVSLDGHELAIVWRGDDAERVFETVRDLAQIVAEEQHWIVVDPGHPDSGLDRSSFLAVVAAVALALALPLCAIGVGAFDRRIYDVDDVRRLGMPALGAVRRFDGDNTGALVARLRPRDRMSPP